MEGSPGKQPDYLAIVKACADFMIEHGRDNYGKVHSPLFASCLDRKTGKLPEGESLKKLLNLRRDEWGIRSADRSLYGANPMHDVCLYQTLYALTQVTGDKKYAKAADDSLRWFFTHCRSRSTNLLPWGEHMCWNFKTESDNRGKAHEFFSDWVLWERSFELAPEGCLAFAKGLWQNQIGDKKKGLFSRHASYHRPSPGTGTEFPRHGGYYIATWGEAYKHSKDPIYLTAIKSLVGYFEKSRNPKTDAIPANSPDPRYPGYQICWPDSAISLAIDLEKAAQDVPDDLAKRMRALADSIDQVFLKIPHDLSINGKGLLAFVRVDTLQPAPQKDLGTRAAHAYLWAATYGQMSEATYMLLALRRYQQNQNPEFRRMIIASADRYLKHDLTYETGNAIWPGSTGNAIGLLTEVYLLTKDKKYLNRADELAKESVKLFFDDSSPLPKASSKHDQYETITHADTLIMALLKLWQAKKDPSVKLPLKFQDH